MRGAMGSKRARLEGITAFQHSSKGMNLGSWPTGWPPVGPSMGHPAITPAQPGEITTSTSGTSFALLTHRHAGARRRTDLQSVVLLAAVEHQSSPEWLFALRMLDYLRDLWDRYIAEHGPRIRRIPIALPIVLVQCPHKWNVPNRLSDLFDGPRPLRDAVRPLFDLQFLVDDMSESVLDDPVTKPSTLALVELTRSLLVAYHAPESITEARIEELAPLFDTVLEHNPDDARALWTYVVSVFDEDSPLRRMLLTAVNKENKDMGRTYKEAWLDEGRLQGLAAALFDVLETRDLSVPDDIRTQVLATRDESGLRRWLRRALVAGTIQQIFEPAGS